MMLSSDQAVKDLLEAHRGAEQPSVAPANPVDEVPKPVASEKISGATMLGIAGIPRPSNARARKRMAGTMLGVAPQGLKSDPPASAAPAPDNSDAPAIEAKLEHTLLSPDSAASSNASPVIPVVAVTPPGSEDTQLPISSLTPPDPDEKPSPTSSDTSAKSTPSATSQDTQSPQGRVQESPPVQNPSQRRGSENNQPMTAGEVFLSIATCGMYALVRFVKNSRN